MVVCSIDTLKHYPIQIVRKKHNCQFNKIREQRDSAVFVEKKKKKKEANTSK